MTVKVKTNKAAEAFLKTMLGKPYSVRVGILEKPEGSKVDANDKKKKSATGKGKRRRIKSGNSRVPTVVEIARIHEFGTRHIPKRSFLLSTYKRKRLEWEKAFIKLVSNVTSEETYVKQLKAYGALMQRDVRLTFTNNNWKPLKYREGTPLVDTGQLRRAIAFNVQKGDR